VPASGDVNGALRAGLAVASASARLDRLALRVRDAWRESLGGLLERALTEDELDAITLRLYEIAPSRYERRELFSWERRWFDEQLPRPPAQLLVTAAGSGREVRALAAEGYQVDALEPVPPMAEALRESGARTVLQATHADLVRSLLGDGHGPAADVRDRRYDAVVIGWGSFTHLLSRGRAHELLAACDALAPVGPILASFFQRTGDQAAERRSRRLGCQVGDVVARVRGSSHDDFETRLFWHLGFTHAYAHRELDELASGVGRTAEHGLGEYGHVTLVKPPAAKASADQGRPA